MKGDGNLLRVTLFFELHILAFHADRAVLLEFDVLPAFTHFILSVETNSADTVPAFRASHRENGTLSSWHSCGSVMIVKAVCKPF
jgi:hypothetical protein